MYEDEGVVKDYGRSRERSFMYLRAFEDSVFSVLARCILLY